jgi:aspartyl protease family protein
MDRESDWPRLLAIAGFITGAAAAAVGLMVYLSSTPKSAVSPAVFARLVDPRIQLVARRLVDEPCNRTLQTELLNGLVEHAEYGTITTLFDEMKEKCGPNEELLPMVFTAQMRSSDFIGAERTADQLIAAYSINPDFYLWRAEAREKLSNFVGAYGDMRITLSLVTNPSLGTFTTYYGLASLASKLGRHCEAAATMRDYVAFDPEKRSTQQLTTIMREWQTQGSCDPLLGTGSALIRFDPKAPGIIAPVEVNGVPGRMLVDTGATRTLLSKPFADRAHIEPARSQGATVTTALGKTWLQGSRVDSIAVAGARLRDVPVFIESTAEGSFGKGIDGLLGLSFLGNFQVRIASGALQLEPLAGAR